MEKANKVKSTLKNHNTVAQLTYKTPEKKKTKPRDYSPGKKPINNFSDEELA